MTFGLTETTALVISFKVGFLSLSFAGRTVASVSVGDGGSSVCCGSGGCTEGDFELGLDGRLSSPSRADPCPLAGLGTACCRAAFECADDEGLFPLLNASKSFIECGFSFGAGSWEAFGAVGPLPMAP